MSNAPRPRSPLTGLFVVSLGASLATMDLAVNVAFPSITAAFALETRSIRWVVICYVLTYSSLMLAFGKLGDRIGHRRVFRAGLLVCALAFVLCALAPDYPSLLAARIVQGVGTALVLSCAPALATLLFDEAKRLSALSGYASLTAFASVVAPIIGGAAIAALDWNGVFWFRVPLAVLALLLMPLLPRVEQPAPRGTSNLAGPVLLATSLAFLLVSPALLEMTASGWFALLTAALGLGALAAFAGHERRAHDPVLPYAVIRESGFVLHNLAAITVHFVAFAVPLLAPYYLTRIAGHAPLEAGAVLALSPAGLLIGSALAAKVVHMIGVRPTALLGGTLVAAGSLSISLWPGTPWLPAMLGALTLHGLGVGLFQVAYTDIVLAALPRRDRGVAGSLTNVTRTVGVMSAATALTALLHAVETRRVAAGAPDAAAFADAFGTVFFYSGLGLVAFFALSALRRRTWFGG